MCPLGQVGSIWAGSAEKRRISCMILRGLAWLVVGLRTDTLEPVRVYSGGPSRINTSGALFAGQTGNFTRWTC